MGAFAVSLGNSGEEECVDVEMRDSVYIDIGVVCRGVSRMAMVDCLYEDVFILKFNKFNFSVIRVSLL